MKKVIVFGLVVLSFALIVYSQTTSQQNKDLEKAIYSIVENDENDVIKIAAITDFNWDKAFLFEPYTPQQHMEEKLGVKYKDRSNISMRDDIYLLVFLHEEKVVQYAEMNRQRNSFSIGNKEYLTPDNDTVYIDRH
ncbi:hypothetical protein [Evansella cellulosilytica]|uniref:Uncharacterized protein n=1 Tax=Evansella cellulosilytica (strain ATCC 21833 / DSM 2522 / FERM P-1141 / JCM 9156 / N-4) TaxID=649639 RepID=E6TWH7_EVAC2|nr:hypothetical protein [Evansella cellulosilytica]ADU32240.1 hypothetical protein Bcell_4009 [Evansella cellulosilytica DSM 2522]